MLFSDMKPYLSNLTNTQEKVIRCLYEKRLTRPYCVAMLGLSINQIQNEELAAMRTMFEASAASGKAAGKPRKLAGVKMERDAGPSDMLG